MNRKLYLVGIVACLALTLTACRAVSRSVTVSVPSDETLTITTPGAPSEMVLVPAGTFQMGCAPEHNGGFPCKGDNALHTIYVDAFQIDRTEVTNAQYAACVAAGACTVPAFIDTPTRPKYFGNPDYTNYPVTYVDWNQSVAYCTWAGKRLPTEAEWEKAARGAEDTRAYPWGDQNPDCELANYNRPPKGCVGDTAAVGSHPAGASPYGIQDMAGNVWEFVSDWYAPDYYGVSPDKNPTGPSKGTFRSLRGGPWDGDSDRNLLVANRDMNTPTGMLGPGLGFRCAADAE